MYGLFWSKGWPLQFSYLRIHQLVCTSKYNIFPFIFYPGHAGVVGGDEVADMFTGNAGIKENEEAIFDGRSVEKMVDNCQ